MTAPQTPPLLGTSSDPKPHAYDPATQPELFEGVLTRRVLAFLVDFCIIFAPIVFASIVVFILGIVTLGLGFMLYWLFPAATVIWALAYVALTLGGPNSATVGMKMAGIEMRTWYGAPMYPLLACVHLVLFYVSWSVLTPLVLLLGLFNSRRRLLHDYLCGTVAINSAERVVALNAIARR